MDARYPVEVFGPLSRLRFPELCTRCADPPAGTLPLMKLFRRSSEDSPTTEVIEGVSVPFCRACIGAHERERRPVDPAVLRSLRNRWLVQSLPFVFPLLVNLWLLSIFVPKLLGALLLRHDLFEALLYLAVTLLFGSLGWWFARQVLNGRRGLIAPYSGDPDQAYVEVVPGLAGMTCFIPGPPTPVLSAVNFSDLESGLFEPERRTFTFANPAVAEEFAALNAERIWDANSPRARRAAWARSLALVAVVLAGALILLYELLGL